MTAPKDSPISPDSNAVSVESTALFACPDCGGKLYEDYGDEGPSWYECDKCDFECDSDFDRETGEISPAIKANDQVELPPNGGSESKKGVVGG